MASLPACLRAASEKYGPFAIKCLLDTALPEANRFGSYMNLWVLGFVHLCTTYSKYNLYFLIRDFLGRRNSKF